MCGNGVNGWGYHLFGSAFGIFFIGIVLHCLVGGLWDCCVMLLDAWVGGRVFDG